MRSAVHDVLPAHVRRALVRFGAGIASARRKRRLTVAMMAERAGVASSTYLSMEKGDARVSLGVYAMALFVWGLAIPWGTWWIRAGMTKGCCSTRNACLDGCG